MNTLTEHLKKFIEKQTAVAVPDTGDQKISVNEAVGALAFYYEKIRNVVDYQDEHLIRQNAIRRIISRRLITQDSYDELAEGLLKELVRFRYFPNNTLAQNKSRPVAKILALYLGVSKTLSASRVFPDKEKDYLLSIAACAVDEYLVPMKQEHALVDLMYDVLQGQVFAPNGRAGDDAMRTLQIHTAVYRILLRPDIHRLRYLLLTRVYPRWTQYDTPAVEELAAEFSAISSRIDALIQHPLNRKLMPSFRRYRIAFVILFTALRNPGAHKLLEKPDELEKEVRKTCTLFYEVQKKKLTGRTIRAFIYIFLTKMIFGMALELPYDLVTIHYVNKIPLFINVLFPPVLLAAMSFSVRLPSEENTDMIVQAIREIAYADTKRTVFVPQRYSAKKKNFILSGIFSILYIVLFALSFGFVAWLLHRLQFNVVSGFVFFLFFCLIAFFGINLRRSVQDLIILKRKSNFLFILLESFFLPIIQVGRWLSFNISRVNIFIFIFDVLIELPLQAIIEITDEWFAFLKEKKDEME